MLEHFFPRTTCCLVIRHNCRTCGRLDLDCEEKLLQIISEFDGHFYNDFSTPSRHVNLEEHLTIWYTDLINLYKNTTYCCTSESTISTVIPLLIDPPPILFFEISPHNKKKNSPQHILSFPSTSGLKKYILSSVIYLGDFHFSCRMILCNGTVWTYDSCINHGVPVLEFPDFPHIDFFLDFKGKSAQTYIYRLASDE